MSMQYFETKVEAQKQFDIIVSQKRNEVEGYNAHHEMFETGCYAIEFESTNSDYAVTIVYYDRTGIATIEQVTFELSNGGFVVSENTISTGFVIGGMFQ